MKEKLVVSFSGGKTSAYMSYMIKKEMHETHDLHFVFANTGLENEETLIFANRCDKEFGLNLNWVEAVVNPVDGIGVTHRPVDFESASRNGEPFADFVRKSGIPNQAYPQCSDRLKLFPIEDWKKKNGLKGVPHAIGIRADEATRRSSKPELYNLVYPLLDWWPSDKIDVNDFFESQDFNLNLMEHEGNCKTCWKKSDKKLFMIALQNPEKFDFFRSMEKHQFVKPNRDGTPRLFFRGHRSVDQLIAQANEFNEMQLFRIIPNELDQNSGCTESCEAY